MIYNEGVYLIRLLHYSLKENTNNWGEMNPKQIEDLDYGSART